MATIHGTCDPRFEELKTLLSDSIDRGTDVGASVAVIHRDDMVVDLWGGYRDEARSAPWEEDTITNVWSTTKTMASLCALVLADRGEIDVHAPVARYWPEFAAEGKADVPVRDLLAHTAGLAGWQEPITAADIYDWEKSTSLLAAQAPWWEPGSACGYHAITQGHLIGEVVRRVTGQTLGQFFAKEIAGPTQADFHIGLSEEDDGRISYVIPPTTALPLPEDPETPAYKVFLNPGLDPKMAHDVAWRRAEIPAANGHGNARGVARAQAAVAQGGESNGVRLLSQNTIDLIFDEQAQNIDLVLGIPLRFGIGYGLPNETAPYLPDRRVCFWGGWGGSLAIVDTDEALTIAYMMNKMGDGLVGDERGAGLIEATYRALAG